jgi:hypothetical protein
VDELHRRLFEIGAAVDLGLVLAGGYALQAHHVLDRPSQDIDFATSASLPMTEIVEGLADAYRRSGYRVEIIECAPRMARLRLLAAGLECEVDVLKEAIAPPAHLSVGSVLAFDDAVGLKMRALHERAAHRDFVDIQAASARVSEREMENLGARHTPRFSLEDLADRLGAVTELDDRGFTYYGLDERAIRELRAWAVSWESDIRARLAAGEDEPIAPVNDEWDRYLAES